MVAWISTSEEEASAFKRGAVGQHGDAMSAMQAVQAMTAVPISTHARYILPLSEQATLVPHQDFSQGIPVIDLSGILDDTRRDATIAAVVDAATSWGVFQIVNHGVPASALEGVLTVAKDFFAMPEEEKLASAIDYTKGVPQGYRPISESFQRNAGWSNQIEYILRPAHLTATEDKFPSAKFRATVEDYGKGLNQVLARLLEFLLYRTLGTKSGHRKSNELLDASHVQLLRIASYEPCPQPDAVMGIRSHVDNSLITGLVQDDTGGLQVEKDGQWYGVAPLPGAIVIMMGTAIQVITNDNIKAVNHRAVVNRHASRTSVTSHLNPSTDTILFPAPELVDEMHPPLYRSFKYGDFRVAAFEAGILKTLDTMEKFRIAPTEADSAKPTHPVAGKPIVQKFERDGHLHDLLRFDRQGILAA